MLESGPLVLTFVLATSLSVLLVPIATRLGHRYNIVTRPGGRHMQEADTRHVSKLGGLCLYLAFTITVLIAQYLPVQRLDAYEVVRLAGLLLGGTVIFVVGLMDDIVHLGPIPLFVGQSIAAGVAIGFQIFIEMFNNPLTGQQTDPWPHIVTVALSYLWLVGMMNTVNFLDGLDGLAAGVAFIAGTMLFINSVFRVEPPQMSVGLLMLALMGCSLGFALYNFYPAQIIMGGGAYYLGYLLGALSIIGGAKMAAILLVMGLPVMDVAWQVVNRLRLGRSPFDGDRGHVHFRLLDIGLSQRQIVIVYYVFCAFFGVLTLVTESRLFKFIALGVMLALVVIGFGIVGRLQHLAASREEAGYSSTSSSSDSSSAD